MDAKAGRDFKIENEKSIVDARRMDMLLKQRKTYSVPLKTTGMNMYGLSIGVMMDVFISDNDIEKMTSLSIGNISEPDKPYVYIKRLLDELVEDYKFLKKSYLKYEHRCGYDPSIIRRLTGTQRFHQIRKRTPQGWLPTKELDYKGYCHLQRMIHWYKTIITGLNYAYRMSKHPSKRNVIIEELHKEQWRWSFHNRWFGAIAVVDKLVYLFGGNNGSIR